MKMHSPEQLRGTPACMSRTLIFLISVFIYTNLAAQPVITSFSPVSGNIGSAVNITGSGFNTTPASNTVFMGSVKATVTAATATSLTVTVPSAATYQPITVTNNGLSAASDLPFNVTLTGVVNAFTATSYSAPIEFNTDQALQAIALADLDNDGKSDVIICGGATNSRVLVFRNTSTGGLISFASPVDAAPLSSSHYLNLVTTDLNNDGKTDIVVSTGAGNIFLLRNNSTPGNININYATEYNVANAGSRDLAAADLDKDGLMDIICTNGGSGIGNSISVFRNTSNGSTYSLAPKVNFTTGTDPYSLVVNDFDKDGKTDIAVANAGANSVTLLKNASATGSLSFSSVATLVTNSFPENMVSGDFNGDGYADIAVVNSGNAGPVFDNRVSVYRNTSVSGTISFSTKTDYTTPSNPKGISAADLDGDGKVDLAVSGIPTSLIAVLKNNSSGSTISFMNRVDINAGPAPYHTSVGDIDGDGYPEICCITLIGTSFKILRSQVGTGSVSLVPPVITSFSPTSGSVGTTVTINGANFSTTPASNIVYFGSAKATVLTATATTLTVSVPAGSSYKPISVTRDNLSAWSVAPFRLTFPDGDAPFTTDFFKPRFDSTTINEAAGMAGADFDGDGKVDFAVSNSNSIAVYKNQSTSTTTAFGPRLSIPVSASREGLQVADINGDGKPDLIANSFGINVLINTSAGGVISFAAPVNLGVSFCQDISIGDLDLDGKPDIIYSGTSGNSFGVLRNTTVNATVSFFQSGLYIFGNALGFLAIGELNGDNKPDVAVVNGDGIVSVYRNTSVQGTISLAPAVTFTATGNPLDISLADVDNDGWRDLVIASNFDSSFSVLRNTSNGSVISFATAIKFRSDMNPVYLGLGDFNGDAKVDVVVSNQLTSSLTVYKNRSTAGTIAFDASSRLPTHIGPAAVTTEDWNADGLPDIGVVSTDFSNAGFSSFFMNNHFFPVITNISPQNGVVGTTVTITGFNFTGATAVRFGGVNAASFTVTSANSITAVTGEGNNGAVTVTTPNGTGSYNSFSFAPPVINSFAPVAAAPGTSVTISGTNFSVIPANNIVYFGATKAQVTAASLTSLTVTVPNGATHEPITVTAHQMTSYSPKFFLPTFAGSGSAITASSFGDRVDSLYSSNPTNRYNPLVRDFDLDGKPDVAVVGDDGNSVFVFRNTSSASQVSFEPRKRLEAGPNPRYLASGDFDGDGKADLVVTIFDQKKVMIWRNTSVAGQLSFATPIEYTTLDPDPRCVVVQDLDRDGRPDLVIVNGFGIVEVKRNNSGPGQISFETSMEIGRANLPVFASVGDFTNDGKPDIVLSMNTNVRLDFIRNTSVPGSFSFAFPAAVVQPGGFPWGSTLGDFDNDGSLDMALHNQQFIGGSAMQVYRNSSTATSLSFGLASSQAGGLTSTGGLSSGDLNGDGKPDIIAIGQTGIPDSIAVFRNTSTGAGQTLFDSRVNLTVQSNPTNTFICDMNGDGKPDIVTAGSGFSVLLNKTGTVTGLPVLSAEVLGIRSYPVPFNEKLFIYFTKVQRQVSMELLKADGTPVLQQENRLVQPNTQMEFDTRTLSAGIYFMHIRTASAQTTIKMVKL